MEAVLPSTRPDILARKATPRIVHLLILQIHRVYNTDKNALSTQYFGPIHSNLSAMATLRGRESGLCREVTVMGVGGWGRGVSCICIPKRDYRRVEQIKFGDLLQ